MGRELVYCSNSENIELVLRRWSVRADRARPGKGLSLRPADAKSGCSTPPCKICGRGRLVDGNHRLTASRLLNYTHIPASVHVPQMRVVISPGE